MRRAACHALDKAGGKTRNADQTISIDRTTVAALRRWRELQDSEREFFGDVYHPGNYLFTYQDGRPPHPDTIRQRFDRLAAAAGLSRITFHDLRHSYATGALRAGVSPKVIRERIGHANVGFFLETYAHVLGNDDREAAEQPPNFCWAMPGRTKRARRDSILPQLLAYNPYVILMSMAWDLILLEEVEDWYFSLDDNAMVAVTGAIDLLELEGPTLGRPTVDKVNGSIFHSMKELRPAGTSIRILFIFDPQRKAILLLGGDKAGNWTSWYDKNIPIAEQRYENWLATEGSE